MRQEEIQVLQRIVCRFIERNFFYDTGNVSFTLSENAGTNPNISYDTATYEIIVQVVWKDNFEGLKINGVSTAQGEIS